MLYSGTLRIILVSEVKLKTVFGERKGVLISEVSTEGFTAILFYSRRKYDLLVNSVTEYFVPTCTSTGYGMVSN